MKLLAIKVRMECMCVLRKALRVVRDGDAAFRLVEIEMICLGFDGDNKI